MNKHSRRAFDDHVGWPSGWRRDRWVGRSCTGRSGAGNRASDVCRRQAFDDDRAERTGSCRRRSDHSGGSREVVGDRVSDSRSREHDELLSVQDVSYWVEEGKPLFALSAGSGSSGPLDPTPTTVDTLGAPPLLIRTVGPKRVTPAASILMKLPPTAKQISFFASTITVLADRYSSSVTSRT